MNFEPIPGSPGLYALPPGDLSGVSAALMRFAGGTGDFVGAHPVTPRQRETLWTRANVALADIEAQAGAADLDRDEIAGLDQLKAALGLSAIDITNVPFSAEDRLGIRTTARAACAAYLKAGYAP